MPARFGIDALRVFVRHSTEDFKLCPGQTVTLGMGVAHHKPDSFGFDRAAHVLFHVIEHHLEASLEVGLDLFNVSTVADKILSHCCPPYLCSTTSCLSKIHAHQEHIEPAYEKASTRYPNPLKLIATT